MLNACPPTSLYDIKKGVRALIYSFLSPFRISDRAGGPGGEEGSTQPHPMYRHTQGNTRQYSCTRNKGNWEEIVSFFVLSLDNLGRILIDRAVVVLGLRGFLVSAMEEVLVQLSVLFRTFSYEP